METWKPYNIFKFPGRCLNTSAHFIYFFNFFCRKLPRGKVCNDALIYLGLSLCVWAFPSKGRFYQEGLLLHAPVYPVVNFWIATYHSIIPESSLQYIYACLFMQIIWQTYIYQINLFVIPYTFYIICDFMSS